MTTVTKLKLVILGGRIDDLYRRSDLGTKKEEESSFSVKKTLSDWVQRFHFVFFSTRTKDVS